MKKSFIAFLAFIALVAGFSTVPAMAEEFSDVSVEKANYTTYTPSMAARGQRFYVGP